MRNRHHLPSGRRPLHVCAFAILLSACGGEAPVVTIEPADATTLDDLVAVVSDGGGNDLHFEWFQDGAPFEGFDGDTISHEATSRGEEWSVQVATNKGMRNAGEASTTIGNAPPSILTLTIEPAEPRSDARLTPVLESEDPDGDDVVYAYLWHLNGQPTNILTETLDPDATQVGDVWGVQVTPYDNLLYGEPAFADVAILNGYPTVGNLTLTPTEAATEDTVFEVTAEGTDPEGDEFTLVYRWYVDDTLVLEGDTTTLTGEHFDKHQQVHVGVAGMDPFGIGDEAVSETVTILNSAPEEPVLTVTPSSPRVGDDLVCVIETEARDADGDEVSYTFSWTLDGAPFTTTGTTTHPGDTVSGAETDCWYAWECTVSTHDGEEAGVPGVVATETICWDGMREFSNCAIQGATGPDQADCDTEYAGTYLEGEVTVTDGIQAWTVPADGTYQIDVYGAQGASGAYPSYSGGLGAWLQGSFDLVAGEVLYIIVGQRGKTDGSNGAGGGGSFVVDASDNPLIIAGGGGGSRTGARQNGCDATTSTFAGSGSSSSSSSCAAKSTDEGEGGDVNYTSYGSAGGGFNSDGANDGSYGKGGSSWLNGGAGGTGSAAGGFGGGGAGNGSYGGGGGGGYSGGDGGWIPGAGGSYNDGYDTDGADGENSAHGSVTIDLLD